MTKMMGFLRNETENEKSKTHTIPPMDFKHVFITGVTGSGKTASMILPTLCDRIEKNNAIIFFEFKGHEHQKIKKMALDNNRLHDVVEIGKPTGSYFNLMSIFDSKMIHNAIVKLCGGQGKDPYWSLSAGKLAVRIMELHRQIHCIAHTMMDNFFYEDDFFTLFLTEDEPDDYSSLYIEEEPSFATMSKIIHTPETLTRFFSECRTLLVNLKKETSVIYKKYYQNSNLIYQIQHLVAEMLIYENMLNKYDNFGLAKDNSEAGGNNGVFQLLNNAISTISTIDSINSNETNLMQKLEEEAIIIIEMQSINTEIYSIFFESILHKLTARLKVGTPKKVSIFIDEANRVLNENMDMYNDVLREARVELILAAQNQEQMILKFGELKWQAIAKNIAHKYHINSEHQAFYDGERLPDIKPFLCSDRALAVIEKKYNSLNNNHTYLISRFLYKGVLPKYFNIIFDSNTFFHNQVIELKKLNGQLLQLKYIGSKIKEKTALQLDIYYEEERYEEVEINISNAFFTSS